MDAQLELRSRGALALDADSPAVSTPAHEPARAPDWDHPALVLEVLRLRHDVAAVAGDLELFGVLGRRLPKKRRLRVRPRTLGPDLHPVGQGDVGALLQLVELAHHGDELLKLLLRLRQQVLDLAILGLLPAELLLALLSRPCDSGDQGADRRACEQRGLAHDGAGRRWPRSRHRLGIGLAAGAGAGAGARAGAGTIAGSGATGGVGAIACAGAGAGSGTGAGTCPGAVAGTSVGSGTVGGDGPIVGAGAGAGAGDGVGADSSSITGGNPVGGAVSEVVFGAVAFLATPELTVPVPADASAWTLSLNKKAMKSLKFTRFAVGSTTPARAADLNNFSGPLIPILSKTFTNASRRIKPLPFLSHPLKASQRNSFCTPAGIESNSTLALTAFPPICTSTMAMRFFEDGDGDGDAAAAVSGAGNSACAAASMIGAGGLPACAATSTRSTSVCAAACTTSRVGGSASIA
mmetsp:Transcript_19663/g.53938  ORF Transcript_19663/g.53938 Transcript_19663/m.53938 type:complete len:464 (-) Transcript_19663:1101-2492(-)